MTTNGPDAVPVAGLLIGRFTLTDGRPGDTREQIADMLAAFEPGTVPILTAHGGRWLGYLDTLTAWDAMGLDLAFSGQVKADPDLIARLHRGVSVSSEVYGPTWMPTPTGPGWVGRERTYYIGQRGDGWTLSGVAITDNPAARGSVMWIER